MTTDTQSNKTKEIEVDLGPLALRAQQEFKNHYYIADIEQKAKVDMHKLRMLGIKYHNATIQHVDNPDLMKYVEDEVVRGIIDLLRDTQLDDMFDTDVAISPSA